MPVFAALPLLEKGQFLSIYKNETLVNCMFNIVCAIYIYLCMYLCIFLIKDGSGDSAPEFSICVNSSCDYYAYREGSIFVPVGTGPRETFDKAVGSHLDRMPSRSNSKARA